MLGFIPSLFLNELINGSGTARFERPQGRSHHDNGRDDRAGQALELFPPTLRVSHVGGF